MKIWKLNRIQLIAYMSIAVDDISTAKISIYKHDKTHSYQKNRFFYQLFKTFSHNKILFTYE